MVLPPLRQALLTTQALKYGKDKNMTTNVIFGHWVALFTRCAVCCHLSELKIFLGCSVQSPMEYISKSLKNILKI